MRGVAICKSKNPIKILGLIFNLKYRYSEPTLMRLINVPKKIINLIFYSKVCSILEAQKFPIELLYSLAIPNN